MLVEILMGLNAVVGAGAAYFIVRSDKKNAADIAERVERGLEFAAITSQAQTEEIRRLTVNLDMALAQSYIAQAPPAHKRDHFTIMRKTGTGWERIGERQLNHPDVPVALDHPQLALIAHDGTMIHNRNEFAEFESPTQTEA